MVRTMGPLFLNGRHIDGASVGRVILRLHGLHGQQLYRVRIGDEQYTLATDEFVVVSREGTQVSDT